MISHFDLFVWLARTLALPFFVLTPLLTALSSVKPFVHVDVQKIDKDVKSVPMVEQFTYEAKNGLLLRNGKPFFWTSDGSSLGGVHSTPLGMWLSRLHGATLVSMPHSSCIVRGAEQADGIHLSATIDESYFSWLREAIRLGFLTQAPEGFFHPAKSASLPRLLAKCPHLLESIYDHGHYMGADPGSDLGLKLLDAKRSPLFTYGGKTGFFMPELNREPGPDPFNNRVKEGFRKWAKRKYGTLNEANRVWRTAFKTWRDVTLPHTAGECVTDSSSYAKPGWMANLSTVRDIRNKRAAKRAEEKREMPEMYWDWMIYVQEDTTAATRREFEHARRFAPAALFGTDVRGHQSARDNYAAYDPVAVDAMADIFYIHSSGFRCYDYGKRPFEPMTLHDAICWPLFTCRFFRCNSTKPIINSEDIIEDVISAAPSGEAMKANDLTNVSERRYSVWRRSDGKTVLSRKFTLASILENDRSDGSKRFYVAGRAAAAFFISLNGKYIGRASAKGAFFKYDVTDLIKFGDDAKNDLVLSFEKGEVPPPDPGCRILTQDTLGRPGVYGKKHYTSQYWSYLTGGQSAAIVWHWNKSERLRLYQAALVKKLEAAAEIVLPAERFRKEKVAFLYSYMAGVGLPASQENRHHELMDWAGALEFSGRRFDVLGEERFRRVASDYPVIVAPDIWCVYDETVEAAKEYVRRGGVLIVTPGSLGKTFSRYGDSGFAAFASGDTGKGRVVVLEKRSGMETLAGRLAPFLPTPELNVEIAPSGEFPCIERLLVGDASRKVLYLQNWGGLDQKCHVTLPEEMRGWNLTRLEGEFIRTADGVETTIEGSQGVAACILSAPEAKVPDFRLSGAEKKKIRYVQNLMRSVSGNGERGTGNGKKRVLFALDGPEPGGAVNPYARHPYTGAELFPHEIEVVRELGAEVDAIHPMSWTPELLSRYAAVVVTEGNSLDYWQALFNKPEFRKMLSDYVQSGGSLFAEVYTGRSLNANMSFFSLGKEAWGVEIPWMRNPPCDKISYGFGDPRQILTDAIGTHPIADGVGKIQLFALTPLKFSGESKMEKVVSLRQTSTMPGACVFAAQVSGKGRVAVSADPMAFQPGRILEADNAALLLNTFGWLLDENVTNSMRENFRNKCRRLDVAQF